MKFAFFAALALACSSTSLPAPSDASPSTTSDSETAGSPVFSASSNCSKAFARRKLLGCPPPEGSAWVRDVCPQLKSKTVKCMTTASDCYAAAMGCF